MIKFNILMPISKDKPLKQWTKDCREEYLDEIIRLEGRGNFTQGHCPSCKRVANSGPFQGLLDDQEFGTAAVRCKDCFGGELVCEDCCVRNHIHNPLHMIEVCLFCFTFSPRTDLIYSAGTASHSNLPHWQILVFAFN
jgi:hypothetical protein